MAGRDELLELLRPPAHRGPLIAAGAVVLTVAIAIVELRLDDELPGIVHVLILGLAAALFLGLGLQAERDGGAPAPPQSVLLVCGLLPLWAGLLRLADLLGADFGEFPAATLVWTSLVVAAAAGLRRGALRLGHLHHAGRDRGRVRGAVAPRTGSSARTRRRPTAGCCSALALVFALASLVLRGGHPRHAELMVVTGGLAILVIFLVAALGALFGAVLPFGIAPQSGLLPGFWELVLLVAGCGLVAYGAVDRVPGAAWLGVAQLAGFVIAASAATDETLLWWPLLLLLLGGGALAAGLRPRMPLPPEPAGYSVQRPLASRTDDDEVTVHVRNDEPPSR